MPNPTCEVAPSVIVPSSCTPNGFTANTSACREWRNGVSIELHVVVGIDGVPVGQGRVHRAMRLERAHPEVDRGVRVPHQHFGRIRRGLAIDGQILGEPGEDRRVLPRRAASVPSTSMSASSRGIFTVRCPSRPL